MICTKLHSTENTTYYDSMACQDRTHHYSQHIHQVLHSILHCYVVYFHLCILFYHYSSVSDMPVDWFCRRKLLKMKNKTNDNFINKNWECCRCLYQNYFIYWDLNLIKMIYNKSLVYGYTLFEMRCTKITRLYDIFYVNSTCNFQLQSVRFSFQ